MDIHEYTAKLTLASASLNSAGAETLASSAQPGMPQHLVDRLPVADAHANKQLALVAPKLKAMRAHLEHELNANQRSRRNFDARFDVFLATAEKVTALLAPKAACKKGCTHCCHIPVAVTQAEANLIGKRIGVRAKEPEFRQNPSERGYGYDKPCTFLVEGACSIYAHRPVACRLHFNLDTDDLLCRLIPEMTVPVPLANMTSLQKAYISLCESGELADIREYFPKGKRR